MPPAWIGLVPALALGLISTGTATRAGEPETAFRVLLAKAKDDPQKADFRALRLAFARTDSYRPYAKDELDTAPVDQELKNGERAAALLALDRTLEGRWMDPAAHAFAADVCERIGERKRAKMHGVFLEKIVDTILGAGDGRSFEKAWPVLSVGEEYLILDAHGFQGRHKQALVHREGHRYDVHTFTDESSGRELKIYFNVDVPTRWLGEHTGGPKTEGEQP
jgi:hypothetical protein